jgi:hypothetical protein
VLFPAYAPELYLAEYVWAQADHELTNAARDDLLELRHRLTDATSRLRRSQHLLWSSIYASDLPWARWGFAHRVVSIDPSGRPR